MSLDGLSYLSRTRQVAVEQPPESAPVCYCYARASPGTWVCAVAWLCVPEQRRVAPTRHAVRMNPFQMRLALFTLWSCTTVAAGAVGLARSPAQWLTIALVALVPPAIAVHFSREPIKSTSQNIQDVLK
jgi:hypothetical protein